MWKAVRGNVRISEEGKVGEPDRVRENEGASFNKTIYAELI